MRPLLLAEFLLAATGTTSATSLERRNTKVRPLQGCDEAVCPSDGSLCNVAQYAITRFGTAASVLTVDNTPLSLTMADLKTYQQITEADFDTGHSYTDHALFLGAPPGFNTTDQKDACALVVLYDFQKLTDDKRAGDTSCRSPMAKPECFERLEGIIRAARAPSTRDGNPASRDRCAALAQDISRNLTASTGHIACGGFGSKFNITGAPLLGRHASPPIHSSSECRPVSPPNYKLHKAVDFGTIGPLKPWDAEDNHTAVAVATVVFENDETSEGADVQFLCLRAVADTAGMSAAPRLGLGVGTMLAVVLSACAFILL
ncbi:hypothetical protein K4F52_005024 [Lecanicillium sp. MT-2017a]|nr:hypothetical protein K4F52_005024 [Lecanicillium sp. MT-2017a]